MNNIRMPARAGTFMHAGARAAAGAGGVHIPFALGLQGHSDADALLHAMTDALLGAAGLGDIGTHFPDTDAQFKERTRPLLARVCQHARPGWQIGNVDSTVIAQGAAPGTAHPSHARREVARRPRASACGLREHQKPKRPSTSAPQARGRPLRRGPWCCCTPHKASQMSGMHNLSIGSALLTIPKIHD